MKKLFTLLTLLLTVVGGANYAWANPVTIGRTLEYSTTPTDYTYVGDANATVTKYDGSKIQGGTGKDLYYKTTSSKKINAYCYRSQYNPGTGNIAIDKFYDDAYAGIKVVLADGKKMTISQMNVSVAVSQNFTYKVVLLDANENVLYSSANKTIGSFNSTSASNVDATIAPDGGVGVVGGTFYVRIYYYLSSSNSKYLAPLNLTVTGEISDATSYTITTATSGDGSVTGAGSFVEGAKATLKATPGASTFTKWTKASDGNWESTDNPIQVVVNADETYTAVFASATTHTITSAIADGQSSYGSITNAGDNVVVEGETITFEATANEGYAFVNWTSGGSEYSTDASITVTSTADATYTANFKKLFTVTYNIDEYNNTTTKALNNYDAGKGINEKYAAANDKYTIPSYSHYYMYRAGYVFSKWKDQDEVEYEKGTEYTLTKDITLSPVWVATTQTLDNSAGEATVTWNFGKSAILFNGWEGSPQVGYYTKPCTVNGELIAIPMIVDGTSGKVDNSSRTDALAQVNGGTKFTIPAIKGMTVVLYANANITSTTVAGNTPSSGSGTKTATYNYTGENGTADIVIADGSYYQKIVVTYPKMVESVSTLPGRNFATMVTSDKLDFSAVDGITAYIATGFNGAKDAIVLQPVDVVDAGTPIIVNTDAKGAAFNVPVTTADASSTAGNTLVAGDGTTAFDGTDGFTYYYIANDQFYKATSGTLKSGKAYLKVANGDVPAPVLDLVFGDVTGIADVRSKMEDVRGDFFDLQGRKVAQPTKGLYIVNGKKVVIK